MSLGAVSPPSGPFGVVNGPAIGEKQSRQLVDEESLTDEMKEALDADTFIIYGKASVEQYDDDDPPQKLEMKTFEGELDSFLEDGIISRRHKDIPVGEPLAEHTLEQDCEVQVGDEVLEYEAGDTLGTGIEDGELWIVADLRNDSELARETRLGAMTGDLDGFSVTVFVKEWEETHKGQRVTDLDWHATTIGGNEQIKNDSSRFGVAEFKALFPDAFAGAGGISAEEAAVEVLEELPANMSTQTDDADQKSFWRRVKEVVDQKAEEAPDAGDGGGDAAEETDEKEGEVPDEFEEEAGGDGGPEEKEDDVHAVLDKVRSELGDEEADALEDAIEAGGDEGPDNPAEGGELKAEEVVDTLSERFATKADLEDLREKAVTEDAVGDLVGDRLSEKLEGEVQDLLSEKLDERLPDEVASKADIEGVKEAAEEAIIDVLPEAQQKAAQEAAEQVSEKAHTGETASPSGGAANDEQDYKQSIQEQFGSN